MSIVAASLFSFFFFNDTATTEIYTLSLHDALPILTLGVATANSVLLITFADDLRREGRSALEAALEAGSVRLRPVCMTALAMIIGMLPMALGLGEGGEQNAPLGRAVIGGLLVATCFTLVVVPVLYSIPRVAPPTPPNVIPEGHA